MLYECLCFWNINLYVFSLFLLSHFTVDKFIETSFFKLWLAHHVMFSNEVNPLDLQVVI